MEKAVKYKHHHISGPRVILFKEDLEQLVELFQSNFADINIQADEYKLTDISEINGLKKEIIYDFRIRGKDNFSNEMSLDISKNSTYISFNGYNDTKFFGINKQIDNIFKRRRRVLNLLNSIRFILLLYFSLQFLLIYNKNKIAKEYYHYIFIIFTIILVFILLAFHYLYTYINNLIHLNYSWEKHNFFKRNKDRIIVGIICAFFGSIATLIVSFIINKFINKPNP